MSEISCLECCFRFSLRSFAFPQHTRNSTLRCRELSPIQLTRLSQVRKSLSPIRPPAFHATPLPARRVLITFPEVAAGMYTVTVTAPNFKTYVSKDVDVQAEQPRGLEIKLELGSASENVTVNAGTMPELQTENADVSATLTTHRDSAPT